MHFLQLVFNMFYTFQLITKLDEKEMKKGQEGVLAS